MRKKPVIWMFSGQGSQYYQMGRDLYEQNAVFPQSMDHCSRFLEPLIKASLCEIIYQPREDRFAPFDHTLYTHPAICSLQYSMAQTLLQQGCRPDYLLGYSVGEVAAHIMAGLFSLENGLRISSLHEQLAEKQINTQRLPVCYAFHSPLMDSIKEVFTAYLSSIPIAAPTIPIISAIHSQRVEKTDPDFLWAVTRSPVDFKKTIERLEAQNHYLYLDIGPSGTLATFVKYNLRPTSYLQDAIDDNPVWRRTKKS